MRYAKKRRNNGRTEVYDTFYHKWVLYSTILDDCDLNTLGDFSSSKDTTYNSSSNLSSSYDSGSSSSYDSSYSGGSSSFGSGDSGGF